MYDSSVTKMLNSQTAETKSKYFEMLALFTRTFGNKWCTTKGKYLNSSGENKMM